MAGILKFLFVDLIVALFFLAARIVVFAFVIGLWAFVIWKALTWLLA